MTQATDTELLTRIATDIQQIKTTVNDLDKRLEVFQAQTNERFNSVDQRFDALNKRIDSLEQRSNGQETRFWLLIAFLMTSLVTALGKVVFFPAKLS